MKQRIAAPGQWSNYAVNAAYSAEGTRAEVVHLLHAADGPVLVYVMDVDDVEAAQSAFATSTLPIDMEHKRVMKACSSGPAESEVLFECSRS